MPENRIMTVTQNTVPSVNNLPKIQFSSNITEIWFPTMICIILPLVQIIQKSMTMWCKVFLKFDDLTWNDPGLIGFHLGF